MACKHRFTTYERVEEQRLVVVKSTGEHEPFDRAKIVAGVEAACKGRAVTAEQIDELASSVDDEVRLLGAEVTSSQVGLAVLERLRSLDEVAYLRFASVYKNFDAASDFQSELDSLSKLTQPTA